MFHSFGLGDGDDPLSLIRIFWVLAEAFEGDGDVAFVRATVRSYYKKRKTYFDMACYFCVEDFPDALNIDRVCALALEHHSGDNEVVAIRACRADDQLLDTLACRDAFMATVDPQKSGEYFDADTAAERFYNEYLWRNGKDGFTTYLLGDNVVSHYSLQG